MKQGLSVVLIVSQLYDEGFKRFNFDTGSIQATEGGPDSAPGNGSHKAKSVKSHHSFDSKSRKAKIAGSTVSKSSSKPRSTSNPPSAPKPTVIVTRQTPLSYSALFKSSGKDKTKTDKGSKAEKTGKMTKPKKPSNLRVCSLPYCAEMMTDPNTIPPSPPEADLLAGGEAWTINEDQLLLKLYDRNEEFESIRTIARTIRRSETSIKARIWDLKHSHMMTSSVLIGSYNLSRSDVAASEAVTNDQKQNNGNSDKTDGRDPSTIEASTQADKSEDKWNGSGWGSFAKTADGGTNFENGENKSTNHWDFASSPTKNCDSKKGTKESGKKFVDLSSLSLSDTKQETKAEKRKREKDEKDKQAEEERKKQSTENNEAEGENKSNGEKTDNYFFGSLDLDFSTHNAAKGSQWGKNKQKGGNRGWASTFGQKTEIIEEAEEPKEEIKTSPDGWCKLTSSKDEVRTPHQLGSLLTCDG